MKALFPQLQNLGSLGFQGVSAERGGHPLFESVTFDLGPSQVLWIQGTNGIGKTTLLRLAAGFSKPYSGQVTWHQGDHICDPENIIAYQGHKNAHKSHLSALENLQFWAEIYGYSDDLATVFEIVELGNKMSVYARDLSAGQSRRLAIARLIISQRPVWIMDEPAAAMDAPGRNLINDIVTRHAQRGGSVLLASHSKANPLGPSPARLVIKGAS